MKLFLLKLLELSLQAGLLTLAILLVRLVFKKLPAKYLCILWAVVAARLIVPVSFETGFGLMPSLSSFTGVPQQNAANNRTESDYYIGETTSSADEIDYYITIIDEKLSLVRGEPNTERQEIDSQGPTDYYMVSASPTPIPKGLTGVVSELNYKWKHSSATPVLFLLWICGMLLLFGYGIHSCVRIKRFVKNAIFYEDNIRLQEGLQTPFLFGWMQPQIYLPTNLEENEIRYVVAHEKAHIARGDQYTKLLGFILLAVYWFNPLIWVAYVTFCKDVERACDEKVIGGLSSEDRKEYAAVLLRCSTDSKVIITNPLAFGETDVKKRITDILKFHKPGRWMIAVAALLCVAEVAGCFFVKEEMPAQTEEPTLTVLPTNPPRGGGPYTPTPTPTPADYIWTQTITHIPSELEQVESDLELLGITTPESLMAVPVGQTVVADLDGDGAEESVTFGLREYEGDVSYNKIMHDSFFLKINEAVVLQGGDDIFHGESPCFTTYYLFDIDVTDGYKEIGLADYGPNGDVGVALYRYENNSVQCIGGFRSAPLDSDNPWEMNDYANIPYEEMVTKVPREEFLISVPGDGTVWAEERDYLLENCSVVKKYQLENASSGTEARLKAARRGHYVFTNWDWEGGIPTTAAYEFKAFANDHLEDDTVVLVPAGSQVTFVEYYLSQEEWGRGYVRFFYTVEEQWDSEGWLKISDYGIVMPRSSDIQSTGTVEPTELFHNLNMAG